MSYFWAQRIRGNAPSMEAALPPAVKTVALGKNCDGVRTKGTYPLLFFPETPYQR